MRYFSRLSARAIRPGAPTGLTGLQTQPTPRSTLIFLYRATLDKLQRFPESSLYRKSVESVTKHRLGLVEKTVPAGYEEWVSRARTLIAENPDTFHPTTEAVDRSKAQIIYVDGVAYSLEVDQSVKDVRVEEWDGEEDVGATAEGQRTAAEKVDLKKTKPSEGRTATGRFPAHLVNEPPFTVEQVTELEDTIGAGLLEEVIQVAEGELKLVDTMHEARVWEPLEEKPVEGQWTYFARDG